MSASRFPACLDWVLKAEGGFVDRGDDPGGPTNLGITSQTLAEYLRRPVNIEDVRGLTRASVAPIYEALYWTPIGGDSLPAGVDLMLFDCAVNQGVGAAVHLLQTAVGVPPDGVIGPVTLAAPALRYPKAVIWKLSTARLERYRANPHVNTFGRGWMNRLAAVTAQAQKDAPT